MRRIFWVLSFLLPLSLISPAIGAPKRKKKESKPIVVKTPIEKDLGKLEWGMSVKEVKKAYYKRLDDVYAAKLKGVRDTYRADKILSQKKREIDTFERSYKKFTSSKDVGRLSISIVGDEITAGLGESMLMIEDEKSERYLFFADDQFYKLLVAYKDSYLSDIDFDTFVEKIAEKHKKPIKTHEQEMRANEIRLLAAEWKDKSASLWVEDRRGLFGSIVLIYTDPTGRQINHASLLLSPKSSSDSSSQFFEDLGRRSDDTEVLSAEKVETKSKSKSKTKSKKTSKEKKKYIDPLEGTGL